MASKNKIFLLLTLFLFFPPASFAAVIPFGQPCATGDYCTNGFCEQSTLSIPQNKFCVCASDSQCETQFTKSSPQETWTCKPGEDKTKNLHYCVSTTRGTQEPIPAGAAPTATPPEATGTTEKKEKLTPPVVSVPIPGLAAFSEIEYTQGEKVDVPYIAQYIVAIYKYGLVIGALLAVVMIMIGGIIYLTAAGAQGLIGTGKTLIYGAISGLVLLLGSYLLLMTINPNLVNPQAISLDTIKGLNIEPGNETSEIVYESIQKLPPSQQSQGMNCYFSEFGQDKAAVSSQITQVTILGHKYSVHKKMAPAMQAAAQEITALNSPYLVKNDGGSGAFNWRQNVNNPTQLSLHSFGIAFDINPSKNPNYKRPEACKPNQPCPACNSDIPKEIIDILKKNGFRWGGDYKSVCDAMHFEWLGPCAK
ncbi:MAG: hypothetical protein UT32_C0006G0031 [Parcubacteria group bacterium GW2011_GWC2_39_14]|nr:MAG: hypothetical protein UT32_C0006G0031 [Parcubacteria group bacterium GW2011_GWC2_39_14]KKR54819.1 MAG: hypothetical protein UT91_C0009G0031 [Parcubacteria group bacterium GW2011_GWA2_40_23]